jgi:hypothetical protein
MVATHHAFHFLVYCCALLGFSRYVEGRAFLGHIAARVEKERIVRGAIAAVTDALGPGHGATSDELLEAHSQLEIMLEALPKCEKGRLSLNSAQYVVHRYFMQNYGVAIRGFEPHREASKAISGLRLLGAPEHYLGLLESGRLAEHGFALPDMVALVTLLERLMRERTTGPLLEAVYEQNFFGVESMLKMRSLGEIFDTWVYHWLMGHNQKELFKRDHHRNRKKADMESWSHGIDIAFGQLELDEWRRKATMNPFKEHEFSFADIERVLHEASKDFGVSWQPECDVTRDHMEEYDPQHIGRIPLNEFHELSDDHDQKKFHEAKSYLRDLGVLDNSSSRKGLQVIIPNYVESISNCVVANRQYSVCCLSKCDSILGRMEELVRSPVARVDDVLRYVKDVIAEETEGIAPRHLAGDLEAQLRRIASMQHNGMVPLHGRLFAQWLHYVFPRVCPFPHREGTIDPRSKNELDGVERTKASKKERNREEERAELRADLFKHAAEEEDAGEVWMAQWSDEEELMAEYLQLRPPWEMPTIAKSSLNALVLLGGLVSLTLLGRAYVSSLRKPDKENYYV